jgi:hypothetical protein
MTDPGRSSNEATHTGKPADTAEHTPEPTLLDHMGGQSGLAYTGLPILAFVLANASFGLQGGIWIAVGVAVAITALRVVREEPIGPAISGLFGVAIAAFIAYRTGSAKGYFLLGIWTSLILAGSSSRRCPRALAAGGRHLEPAQRQRARLARGQAIATRVRHRHTRAGRRLRGQVRRATVAL